jgi:hypothetical protein
MAIFRSIQGTRSEKLDDKFSSISSEILAGIRVCKGNLTSGNSNSFAFTWQNPESTKIIVLKVVLRITSTGGTAGSVIDVGIVANATSTADTLIDGLDINQVGLFDNITNKGTNGLAIGGVVDENGGTNDYITGKILTQNATSLAGKYYIYYVVV